MTFTPFAGPAPLQLQATTGVNGFGLQNATPDILTWTAPSDGEQHRATIFASLEVTSAETGGTVVADWTFPSGSGNGIVLAAGGQAAGNNATNPVEVILGAGTTVTVRQSAALTAGAATIWAEIWGS